MMTRRGAAAAAGAGGRRGHRAGANSDRRVIETDDDGMGAHARAPWLNWEEKVARCAFMVATIVYFKSKPIRFSNSIIKINRSAPEHEPLLSQVKSACIRNYYF